jgi:hypothetical protein
MEDSRTFLDRRRFLGSIGLAGAALASVVPTLQASTLRTSSSRPSRCAEIKKDAAQANAGMPMPANSPNRDEETLLNRIGNYHKGLAHNEAGEVENAAYQRLLHALESGIPTHFESIPMGGNTKLSNPQGGLAFDLEGCDPCQTFMTAAPQLSSAWRAAEAVEDYWMALLRDVNFAEYSISPLAQAAILELDHLQEFRGPKLRGSLSPGTLFRGCTPGDLVGPYISQFLVQPFWFGALRVNQQIATQRPALDYMTDAFVWLRIQNGQGQSEQPVMDPKPRYIRNGRDLSSYVHADSPYQAYIAAAQWMMQNDVPLNVGNPYEKSLTQEGFQTFGGPHVLSLLAEVSNRALKAVWYYKWYVHRALRPEAYGGLVHWTATGKRNYPIHQDVLNSTAAAQVFGKCGTYLLPQAYPEGCPLHPSYGQGHAAIAGACVTVLKAFFATDNVTFYDPVEASADGLSLVPYKGPDVWQMSVTSELHKLAGNIAMGRNFAGIHWRSDYDQALLLGETVAISILRDQRATFNEKFEGFTFTKFDGSKITV